MLYKPFQFCYYNASMTVMARKHKSSYTYTKENIKILTELFGFTNGEVTTLMSKQSFHIKEPGELEESYQFYKSIGYSNNDFLKYPSLLIAHPVSKINHYNALEDTGCRPIDSYLLSRATSYLRGKIIAFKKKGYLAQDVNVADRLMTFLDPPIEKPKILRKELKILDEMSWSRIHKAILVNWLKIRLNATDDDIVKLLRIHGMIKNKSFRTINENITLAKSLGLSNEKILKCGYLLHNHPEYPKTILRDHPNFAGIDVARAYKIFPKMAMVNPRRMQEIYAILKEFNVSDKLIQNKPDVFTMSPVTLRDRLKDIQSIPDFRVLFDDPRMLKLIVHHKVIKSRLSFLKSLHLRCASLNFVGDLGGTSFDDYIQQGKDMNRPGTVVSFFCRLLDKDREFVERRLEKHPYYYYIPFIDIDATFQYLLRLGYKKDNIARCLLILLYSRAKISRAIRHLHADRSLNFRGQSQCKQLSLLLYCIEKEHHFTGDGVWTTNSDSHFVEDHTLE